MKLLFLDAYFNPEKIAFTHLENDLIESFVSAGNEIDIICPTPTRGIDADTTIKYKKIRYEENYNGKVRIHRFIAPNEGKNAIRRAIRYLWCNFRTYHIGKAYKNSDVIFCNSTPPTQGLVAAKLKKKLKCRFLYSLQDIFPDSLATTGIAKESSIIWSIGRLIERITYDSCDNIVVITKAMKENLLKKQVQENKITVIPNWVDTNKIKPVGRCDNHLFSEYNINRNKFLVVYAGNFGVAQGVDIIIDAAKQLKTNDNIQFVIFGGGSEYENAVKKIRVNKLDNVIINPLLSQDCVSEVYSLGDVALVTCKKGVGNSGMPSKVWSILACGTPIIACFDTESELSNLIKQNNIGLAGAPGNVADLVNNILILQKDREDCATKANNTRSLVIRDYGKNKNVGKYLCLLYGESH